MAATILPETLHRDGRVAALPPLTVRHAIPASTSVATLRYLARRYADSADPIVRSLPPHYARQLRGRLIWLLCGDVDEVTA